MKSFVVMTIALSISTFEGACGFSCDWQKKKYPKNTKNTPAGIIKTNGK